MLNICNTLLNICNTLLNVCIQAVGSAAVGLNLLDHFKKLPFFPVVVLPTIKISAFLL